MSIGSIERKTNAVFPRSRKENVKY